MNTKVLATTYCLFMIHDSNAASTKLPAMNIDPSAITISGISSGADFVVQFHVAFSGTVKGVGVFAGQPMGCAVTRFPDDEFRPRCAGDPTCDVPVCNGCPPNKTLTYDHCKQHPEWVVPDLLANITLDFEKKGLIDPVENMKTHPVYIYRGTKDGCYVSGSEAQLINYYTNFVGDRGKTDGGLVAFENTIPSLHAQPTIHNGSPCGGPYTGPYSYLASCGYDGAGAALQHLYQHTLKQPVASANLTGTLITFDQTEFFTTEDPGLENEAFAFIPPQCLKNKQLTAHETSNDSATVQCKLHLWHHGCGGPDRFYNASVYYAGFNEWAQTNNMVIIYPAMRVWGTTPQTKAGCWDGYAQTGPLYNTKQGLQMQTVRNIIKAASGI
eukprot:m.121412 g.121412  ORF g.121412 m.121412 type:complete len:384 (-) comp28853_c0_seq3:376-1527(-)